MVERILRKTNLKHGNCNAVVLALRIRCDPGGDHEILICDGCGYEIIPFKEVD